MSSVGVNLSEEFTNSVRVLSAIDVTPGYYDGTIYCTDLVIECFRHQVRNELAGLGGEYRHHWLITECES